MQDPDHRGDFAGHLRRLAALPVASGSTLNWETLNGAVTDNGNVRTVVDLRSATTGGCLYRARITKP